MAVHFNIWPFWFSHFTYIMFSARYELEMGKQMSLKHEAQSILNAQIWTLTPIDYKYPRLRYSMIDSTPFSTTRKNHFVCVCVCVLKYARDFL